MRSWANVTRILRASATKFRKLLKMGVNLRVKYAACLLMLWTVGFVPLLNAQESPTPNLPESAPLSEAEKRETVLFIEKFSLQVEAERILREALKHEREFAERERELARREIDAEKRRAELAEKEAADQKERADTYARNFKEATKGRGFGCVLKKVFTIGLGTCL